MIDIVHGETREVDIVHRFARQSLTIDEHQHALAAKSGEVHVRLLVHGIGEFHTRQDVLQQVLQVGGIGLGNLRSRDDFGQYGRVEQQFGRARPGDDHGVELRVPPGSGVLRFGGRYCTDAANRQP